MKNNKHIYEYIMKDISKIVKKHISEAEEAKTDVENVADKLIIDINKHKMPLETAISLLKIISKGHEKNITYNEVSYDKLIPELESRLEKKSVNDNYKIKRFK